MKFLLAAVSIIAVYAVDGQYHSNEPGEQQPATTDEAQVFPDGEGREGGQNLPGGPGTQNSEEPDKQHMKNNAFELDRSDLVNEDTEMNEGDLYQQDDNMQHERKGKNTLAKKIQSLENEIKSLRNNLTDSDKNLTKAMIKIDDKLDNITNSIAKIVSKQGCPVGFFHTAGSRQCYIFFNDTTRSWIEAKEKCKKEGLLLAEPANPLSLRKFVVETYGQKTGAYAWIGARGTGSYFRWERLGKQISNSDSLWYTGHPGKYLSTSYCILMLAEKNTFLVKYPNQPYYAYACSNKQFTVCEYV